MCECSLTQTTVDPGQRYRASCGDADPPPVDAALPADGATGRCHGNSEPDCVGAGEGAGAVAGVAGANPPCGGALVVEASWARQAFRNCGQVSPLVVPASFAACH